MFTTTGSRAGRKRPTAANTPAKIYVPLTTGAIPAVFVQNPDGSLILTEYV